MPGEVLADPALLRLALRWLRRLPPAHAGRVGVAPRALDGQPAAAQPWPGGACRASRASFVHASRLPSGRRSPPDGGDDIASNGRPGAGGVAAAATSPDGRAGVVFDQVRPGDSNTVGSGRHRRGRPPVGAAAAPPDGRIVIAPHRRETLRGCSPLPAIRDDPRWLPPTRPPIRCHSRRCSGACSRGRAPRPRGRSTWSSGASLAEVGLADGDDVSALVELTRAASAAGRSHGEWLEDVVMTLGRTVHVLRECGGAVLHARLDPARGDVDAIRRALAGAEMQRAVAVTVRSNSEGGAEGGAEDSAAAPGAHALVDVPTLPSMRPVSPPPRPVPAPARPLARLPDTGSAAPAVPAAAPAAARWGGCGRRGARARHGRRGCGADPHRCARGAGAPAGGLAAAAQAYGHRTACPAAAGGDRSRGAAQAMGVGPRHDAPGADRPAADGVAGAPETRSWASTSIDRIPGGSRPVPNPMEVPRVRARIPPRVRPRPGAGRDDGRCRGTGGGPADHRARAPSSSSGTPAGSCATWRGRPSPTSRSRRSPPTPTTAAASSGTRPRTCSRRPCSSCARRPSSASARRSPTASTTTSTSTSRSPRTT